MNPNVQPSATNVRFFEPCQFCQTRIGKAQHFQVSQARSIAWQAVINNNLLCVYDFADPIQEPRIEFCHVENLVIGQAVTHRLCDSAHAIWGLPADCFDDCLFFWGARNFNIVKPCQSRLHRCQRLLQGFVDGSANRHRFANRFHSRC